MDEETVAHYNRKGWKMLPFAIAITIITVVVSILYYRGIFFLPKEMITLGIIVLVIVNAIAWGATLFFITEKGYGE